MIDCLIVWMKMYIFANYKVQWGNIMLSQWWLYFNWFFQMVLWTFSPMFFFFAFIDSWLCCRKPAVSRF